MLLFYQFWLPFHYSIPWMYITANRVTASHKLTQILKALLCAHFEYRFGFSFTNDVLIEFVQFSTIYTTFMSFVLLLVMLLLIKNQWLLPIFCFTNTQPFC